MEFALTTFPGAKPSTTKVKLADNVFAVAFNSSLVHQILTAYMAAARSGSKQTKSRGEVACSTAKRWRQKGTGRARVGNGASPNWRSGGMAFAARVRDYSQKVNRKMYRAAMRCIVSEQVRQQGLVVVDNLQLETPKTQEFLKKFDLPQKQKLLLIDTDIAENLHFATRNLHWIRVTDMAGLDPVSLYQAKQVVMTQAALTKLEEWLS